MKQNINIAMPMYNLIEYSNNYSDTSGSLWQFKRDEIEGDVDLTADNLSSFKYKSSFIGILMQMEQIEKRRCKNSCTIKIFK